MKIKLIWSVVGIIQLVLIAFSIGRININWFMPAMILGFFITSTSKERITIKERKALHKLLDQLPSDSSFGELSSIEAMELSSLRIKLEKYEFDISESIVWAFVFVLCMKL